MAPYDSMDPFSSLDLAQVSDQLEREGCYLIQNAYDPEFCRRGIQFIDEHDHDAGVEVNYGGSEVRLWSSENKNAYFADFYKKSHELLAQLTEKARPKTLLAMRNLAISSEARDLQLGRWHIDSFFRQMKVFLFLTDTTESTGPFEFIPASHRKSFKLKMLLGGHYFRPTDLLGKNKHRAYQRLDDEFIERLGEQGYSSKAVVCRAGTVMIVNTSAIHRARPCLEGKRYVLTSYFD